MVKSAIAWLSAVLVILISSGGALGIDYSDQALFSSVAPDAMIVLDLSGSMRWSPAGDQATGGVPGMDRYGNPTCSGSIFYPDAGTPGFATFCARYEIARKKLFGVIDDNKDGVLDAKDESSLNIRFGLGSFQGSSYAKRKDIGTKYGKLYCGKNVCTMDEAPPSNDTNNIRFLLQETNVSGATPLVVSLQALKDDLDADRKRDPYQHCRQKFVILITDGADTMYCSGIGSESQPDMHSRRKASVLATKAFADAGYRVFVIGLGGNMPETLKNTLNWMAYWGGTENISAQREGNTSAFDPGAVTGCGEASASNDPGNLKLAGYAFLANDSKQLETALRMAMSTIRDAAYSFSTPSVTTSRTSDENYLYASSFLPSSTDPFWKGSLKKYTILSDQSVGSAVADAGSILQGTPAGERKILTAKGMSLIPFTVSNLSEADLGVSDKTRRDEIVGYIRGEAATNPDKDAKENVWKLGDIFHSNPVTVGTPSAHFLDPRDKAKAFDSFRNDCQRTSINEKRIIVAGANDGQLHAFRTSDLKESWSFIPPNFLDRLKDIAHKEHPATLSHRFYVDGPITVADVWTGAGDGKVKSPGEWKTMLVVGLGQGGDRNLWSSSSSCDAGFSSNYLLSGEYPYYCGYHALDITDTLNPVYRWRIRPTASQAPYLGDPWSRMVIRRVRVGTDEKWVGFIGGGHQTSSCAGAADCDARGKGFFVIELATGNVLWSFNRHSPGGSAMTHALPAPAALIDSDQDGFADRAYIGDLGGNIWRFSFCKASDGDGCTKADWKGSLFFRRDGDTGPVYYAPAVARDVDGNIWVYWGTGDRLEPVAQKENKDGFFGVRDRRKSTPLTSSNLQNISGATQQFTELDTKDGWYILLGGKGEKVLANPTIFGGVAYFTTYTPENAGGDPCEQVGNAKLYGVSYIEGAGTFTGGYRSGYVGKGLSSAPLISAEIKAGKTEKGGMFGWVSGGSSSPGAPWTAPPALRWPERLTHLLHWRDARIR